jgi:hypothetical protein
MEEVMRRYRIFQVVVIALVVFGMMQVAWAAQKLLITPRNVVINFQQRELKASPAIKSKLLTLRQQIKTKNLKFQVGYTTALDYRLEQITGLRTPAAARLTKLIKAQNVRAAKVMKALPALKVPACSTGARKFDWRMAQGTTGVRDQGACGSCWAFATHGAFEGNYRIRNKTVIDSSEQDTLDCSGEGSCAGGWWAHQYLINKGSAIDAGYPYTAHKGTCKNVSRPYKAITWGYVGNSSSIPSVSAIKQALCQHGPLAVALRATGAFQAYSGGVFDEFASGRVNHGVTLIGWDDSKGAWLIKNSWGAGWGSTCGVGSERGYMWIKYNCNKVGYAASWVEAKPKPVPAKEDCISFNPRRAQVKKIKNSWKIVDGSHWMFDFGTKRSEAVKALAIIKHYKMNRSCFVGRPGPSFQYLLVGNRAPKGAMKGEDCVRFNPRTAQVKQIKGRWKIVDGSHWMFDFGKKKKEAYASLKIIKKYGFTSSCFVGRPKASFTYLRQ